MHKRDTFAHVIATFSQDTLDVVAEHLLHVESMFRP